MNRLVEYAGHPVAVDKHETECVQIRRLDEFCAVNGVDHIDYLKIDTEGADLDVLKGAEPMLADQRIDLIEVETGMNRGNKYHVPFETIKAFMEDRSYFVFGIYEQCAEWPTDEVHLRRTNSVFISRRMIESHRQRIRACA